MAQVLRHGLDRIANPDGVCGIGIPARVDPPHCTDYPDHDRDEPDLGIDRPDLVSTHGGFPERCDCHHHLQAGRQQHSQRGSVHSYVISAK